MATQNKELELIKMVQQMQHEQSVYFYERKKYGSSPTQLEKCKSIENKVRKYCKERKEEITNTQIPLFH